jgi:hypothetical protein
MNASAVAVEIHATGVAIRAATDEERLAYRRTRAGVEFEGWLISGPAALDDIHVVGQAFVEFADLRVSRWELLSAPHRIELDAALAARLILR